MQRIPVMKETNEWKSELTQLDGGRGGGRRGRRRGRRPEGGGRQRAPMEVSENATNDVTEKFAVTH